MGWTYQIVLFFLFLLSFLLWACWNLIFIQLSTGHVSFPFCQHFIPTKRQRCITWTLFWINNVYKQWMKFNVLISVANEHPEGKHPEICICILYNFCLLRRFLCLQNFNSFSLPFVSVMCISRNYPYPPPPEWQQKFWGDGGGDPKRGNFRGSGGLLQRSFSRWSDWSWDWWVINK